MSELTACLRGVKDSSALPANPVVITVDDGHRDFYATAYPILREFAFPAIMYLPTAFMDGAWLWFDRFQYIFQHTPLNRADLAGLPPIPEIGVDLSSPAAREEAFQNVARPAQWLPAAERDRLCERLAKLLRVEIPERPPEAFAPLTWDEVREMARHGIEFGGHTINHPILQTLHTPESLAAEIAGCKTRIETELGSPISHFAYTSGKAEEVPAAAKEAVARAGFETAVTTLTGRAGATDDPYWLPPSASTPAWTRCGFAARWLLWAWANSRLN